ncbi:MAG: glycosyltransferase family 4 protein [Sphingobacteriales bacterium]|nr:glycosyltransferase family 4 protein [Sphingobacteriales bacterium]
MIYCLLTGAILFILELLYFKLADHFNIIDKPNQRSSHQQITLRGGGIIFPIAGIATLLLFQPQQWRLAIGIMLMASISFLDDVMTLSSKIRMLVHLIAVSLLLYQAKTDLTIQIFTPYSLLLLPILYLFIIGIINAYNFMDGINGITVMYSLVSVGTLFWIQKVEHFILLDDRVWWAILASLCVFGFFNVRKKAKAFSGDVGSITMAFILCFTLLMLILHTENLKWILLLGIYGIDTVFTICSRLIKKENIFEAHRSHFYQYLANEKKMNHLQVSLLYAILQLLLNLSVVFATLPVTLILFFVIVVSYLLLRIKLEGYQKLFSSIAN